CGTQDDVSHRVVTEQLPGGALGRLVGYVGADVGGGSAAEVDRRPALDDLRSFSDRRCCALDHGAPRRKVPGLEVAALGGGNQLQPGKRAARPYVRGLPQSLWLPVYFVATSSSSPAASISTSRCRPSAKVSGLASRG